MNVIQSMMARVELFDATKAAIGRALTPSQQVAVSAKLAADQGAFIRWLGTDAGITASRAMADAFTVEPAKEVPKKTLTEVSDNS